MSMELTGVVLHVLPEVNGTSKKGPWRKQEYVMEMPGTYPKKVCFSAWGDKIDQFGIRQGDTVTVSLDIDCKEYNGKWFNDVRAWKVTKGQGAPSMPSMNAPVMEPYTPVPDMGPNNDDLPF